MEGDWLPLQVSKGISSKRKKITYIIRIRDHYPLETGHKTRYWCCQDQDRKQKSRPSQREGAIHRDTLGMHRYNCKSNLNISCRTNPRSKEKTYTITIWLEHHMRHTPYYDVSLPPEAAALIRDSIEYHCPNEVAKKVLLTHPSITAKQVHTAWTTMSETLWKRSNDQVASVKALLGELQNDAVILDLPRMEGVKQVAWVMKRVMVPLQGRIVEIGIDATCERQSDHSQRVH